MSKNNKTEKSEKKNKKAAKAAAPPAPKAAKPERAGKDAFGGRIGSRSNKINAVLIDGYIGTAAKIAEKADEPVANVSAQLSWLHSKGLVARKKDEATGDFIYKMSKAATNGGGKPAKTKATPAAAEETEAEETTTE